MQACPAPVSSEWSGSSATREGRGGPARSPADLAGAVDQHDPPAAVGVLTLVGLIEDLGDDLLAGRAIEPTSHLAVATGPWWRR